MRLLRVIPWIIKRLPAEPITRRVRVQRRILSALNLPLVGSIYDRIYFATQVRRKAYLFPKLVSIESYNACNLKCVMCPYPDMSRPKVKMSPELFSKVVDNAVEVGITELNLNVYNEPLLDSSIFDKITYAKSRGMKVGFFTNGTLLTKDRAEQMIISGLDRIVVSIDGASKENYESIRIGANFDDVVRNTKQLLELRNSSHTDKPFVTVSCIIQKDNYVELTTQPEYFRQLFKEADEVCFWLVDNRKDDTTKTKLNLQIETRAKRVYPCPRPWQELVVLSNGKVVLCCMDYDGSVELGDLNSQSIKEVWDSVKFSNIRQMHMARRGMNIPLCATCCGLYQWGLSRWWHM